MSQDEMYDVLVEIENEVDEIQMTPDNEKTISGLQEYIEKMKTKFN